jgi:acyl-CoA reductase-like NAD-dependent aldehyde dehydrogenase
MTAINTVAPALIAGNTVILKHAGQTLAVGDHLAEAFHAAGVPEDVFQNLVLDHDTTSALLSERAVDFVNFTGSRPAPSSSTAAITSTPRCAGPAARTPDAGKVCQNWRIRL